ncbi:MAG: hypothetical protein RJA63_1775 [Pseudomonadota bacterium]|jgi:guanosine-3',5'-bis(diphosphate) 3'-pyrophosphohydrolase
MRQENQLALLLRAAMLAADKHRAQRRKDSEASPYINHPLALADLLAGTGGVDDVDVVCAALLHDTIEETECTSKELMRGFGQWVADIVAEVIDDKSLPKEVRKQLVIEHASHLSAGAKLVKLADLVCNERDVATSPPVIWDQQRCFAYFAWAHQVAEGLRGTCSPLEKAFDDWCGKGCAEAPSL